MTLSLSAQALYMHLVLEADDDGFVGNPKTIIRSIGAQEKDAVQLVQESLIEPFRDGVVLVCNWHEQNVVKTSHYKRSMHLKTDEDKIRYLEVQGEKTLELSSYFDMEPLWSQHGATLEHSIGKDRIGKVRLGKEESSEPSSPRPKREKTEKKYNDNDMRLAELLKSKVEENFPMYSEDKDMDKWADQVRLMRERDNLKPEMIEFMIIFVQGGEWKQKQVPEHSFWSKNIRSTSKLRKQKGNILAEIQQRYKLQTGIISNNNQKEYEVV